MSIRIHKKQIKRKLAAGYPISYNDMKFGLKHKMTDDIFHDHFILFGFYATEASIQATQSIKRIGNIALLIGQSASNVVSQLKKNIPPDLSEVLNNGD